MSGLAWWVILGGSADLCEPQAHLLDGEGLHRHVDGGIEEDEGEEAEPHRAVEPQEKLLGEIQAACVRQEGHDQHGDDGAHQQIGLATAHAAPGAVGPASDERLDDHTHL